MITKEKLDRMDQCRHLLDAPAPEVCAELIEEIRRLTTDNGHMKSMLEAENPTKTAGHLPSNEAACYALLARWKARARDLEVPRWKSCLIDWGRICTFGLWKPSVHRTPKVLPRTQLKISHIMETILLSALDAPNRRALLEILDRHTLIELSGRDYNPDSLHKLVEDISHNETICSNIELTINHVTF